MYSIIDIETTGGNAANSGITEIAIYVHDGQRVVQHFTSLINPLRRVPDFITALTGISNAMVAIAPTFEELAPTIYHLISDTIFVAHNVNFDFSFVQHNLTKCGLPLNVKKLCTVRLARKALPGLPSYSLGKLCRSININIDGRHRADGDAKATVQLFEKILANGGEEHINKMLKRTSAEHWLPIHLDKKVIDNLPPTAGVYYFYNNKGKIIYVGKAINIKKRVTSHFTNVDVGNRRQQFLRTVTNITFINCANELHALILESTEIRKYWPTYNYAQKQPAQKYALYSFEDNRGYIRLAIDKRQKNLPALYNFNLLHEGQILLRNMLEEFSLNEKLCYINKKPLNDNDMEFLEEPLYYNGKVKIAVESLSQQLPTFALIDDGLQENEKLYLLIEKGNFWGMGYVNNDANVSTINTLKENLQPYADNDFIRNSIYNYANLHPHKKLVFKL